MTQPKQERRTRAQGPPTAVWVAYETMPSWQRTVLFVVGMALVAFVVLVVGLAVVRDSVPGIPVLVFLGALGFVGFMAACPKAACYLVEWAPLPRSWTRRERRE